MTKSLIDKYTINTRYQRSARIDTDWKNDIVKGYVLHETARNIVLRISEQLSDKNKPQKSFTITGPYGGGKSSLALIISNLVNANPREQKKTLNLFDNRDDRQLITKAFASTKKGWVIIRVVGSRSNPVESIFLAAKEAVKNRFRAIPKKLKRDQRINLKNLLSYLDAVNEELAKTNDGMMLLVDEMGKFLEHAAYENGDIFVFQEIAEKFNRSKNKNLFIGILHQAMGEYAKSLNKVTQEEWNKIQGRFLDLPFSVGVDEVVQLLGQAIEGPSANTLQKNICQKIAKSIKGARLGTTHNISEKLYECIPLHPTTALLLGPISRRRFGQNERSIFSFLTSGEPNSLNHFLKSEQLTSKNLFTLDLLWDYLQINLEPLILSSSDGHLWSQAVEALTRVEKKGKPEHTRLVKTIALVEIFGKQFGIRPTNELLESALSENIKISKQLKELESWSIVIYRKHLSAWGLFAGSDIDLEELIEISSSQVALTNNLVLQSIPFQNPIVAKEHYQNTGTMRWFEMHFVFSNDLHYFLKDKSPKILTGQFLIILKQKGETREEIQKLIEETINLTSNFSYPILLGCPDQDESLLNVAYELSALERIQATHQKLQGDAVARKELNARITDTTQQLNEIIKTTLDHTEWYHKQSLYKKTRSLSNLSSAICNKFYYRTPIIKNELINRDKVSGVAVGAAKVLLKAMILHGDKEYFGIEGFPPEKSMYLSLFRKTGIHQRRSHDYHLALPKNHNDPLREIWMDCVQFLKDNQHRRITLTELFKRWAKPPHGIRQGVMPILAVTIFEAHQEELALFVDDLFFPDIDDYSINKLYHNTDSISLRYVELAGFGKDTLKKVSEIFQDKAQSTKHGVLEVAKKIVQFVLDLKPLVKRTDRISPQTLKVRNSILNGRDPFELLFRDLPIAYGIKVGEKLGDMSDEDAKKLPSLIKESLNELKTVELKFDQELKESVYSALGYNLSEPINTKLLAERAERIKGISGDFSLESFIMVIINAKDDPNWIITLASLAAEKSVANWFDLDFDRAKYEMYSLVSRFKRVENHVLNNAVGKGIYSISAVTSLEEQSPKELNLSVQLEDQQISQVNAIAKKIDDLLQATRADEQVKLAVMSTLLNNAKTKEEDIKKKRKLN